MFSRWTFEGLYVFHDAAIKEESGLSSAVVSGGDEFWGKYVAVAVDEAQH